MEISEQDRNKLLGIVNEEDFLAECFIYSTRSPFSEVTSLDKNKKQWIKLFRYQKRNIVSNNCIPDQNEENTNSTDIEHHFIKSNPPEPNVKSIPKDLKEIGEEDSIPYFNFAVFFYVVFENKCPYSPKEILNSIFFGGENVERNKLHLLVREEDAESYIDAGCTNKSLVIFRAYA